MSESFHVSEYISEELEARGWSRELLATKMQAKSYGLDLMCLEFLLDLGPTEPHLWLDRTTAEKLASAFGVEAELFLRLDRAWHLAQGVTEVPESAK